MEQVTKEQKPILSGYQPLFVYGTLKDEEICKLLFEEEFTYYHATLQNYVLKKSSDYFFVTPLEESRVVGKVIFLSDKQLLIADKWEEVPFYTRKIVKVLLSERSIDAWAYVRDSFDGENADENKISSMDRLLLINEVKSFKDGL
jgi:gamma-glutamylcyclotransferase (GGCT)/AIG2-like uncharacterized protein YtfP